MIHDEKRPVLQALQLRWDPHAARTTSLVALGIGVVGIGATLAGLAGDAQRALGSYLFAYMLFLQVALGSLFFVMVHHLAGARWGVSVRRLAEATAATLPVFAVLFVPIWLGRHELFHWTHEEAVAGDALLQGKAAYLNVPFFTVRAVIYFAVWAFLGTYLFRLSVQQDRGDGTEYLAKMRRASAPGMFLFGITLTFAAFDWLMSLDPHWFSTIFGVYYFAGGAQGVCAFLVVLVLLLQRRGLLEQAVTVEHKHDLGKLLFAFTVFFAYIGFSQYFLIWYANIPEETIWFTRRWGAWSGVSLWLVALTFVLPFLVLLGREAKRSTAGLLAGAGLVLLGRIVDLYWMVMPTFDQPGPALHWTNLTALLGIGGVWAWLLVARLGKHALVPVGDPHLAYALGHENV
jgi:hypothetical protein